MISKRTENSIKGNAFVFSFNQEYYFYFALN